MIDAPVAISSVVALVSGDVRIMGDSATYSVISTRLDLSLRTHSPRTSGSHVSLENTVSTVIDHVRYQNTHQDASRSESH
jgi:hypothetical protein